MPAAFFRPLAFVFGLCLFPSLLFGSDPEALSMAIQQADLNLQGARQVSNLRLDTGFARLRLLEGTLFPVQTAAGDATEMIFIGHGELEVDPDDSIESSQLDLFAGSSVLNESFTEAVLAIALDSAGQALLSQPAAENPSAEVVEQARSRFDTWRQSPVRKVLDVETGLLLDQLGEPLYQSFFGAWFNGEELGELLLSVQPESTEQLTLGRFEAIDLTAKEKRKLKKAVGRLQKEGRFLGLEIDELGTWDTWVSTSLHRAGEPSPGIAAFEPRHYKIQTDLNPKDDSLRATVRIDLATQVAGSRTVGLSLSEDLLVDAVRDASGNPLFHLRVGRQLRVFLPASAPESVTVEIDYHGKGLQSGRKVWLPTSNLDWYPRTGNVDRATYDLELTYPLKWDMVASGRLHEEQQRQGGYKWQRRTLDRPGLGVSFAFGDFKQKQAQIGHVALTLAFDRQLVSTSGWSLDEIVDAVQSSLTYFEKIYGPYPEDYLSIVSVPTTVSQSLPTFINLSSLAMIDNPFYSYFFGLSDRRTVVAHELAHQWWGNSVGWRTYRDQWISEAMANYSALLWSRRGTEKKLRVSRGPTYGWRSELTATLADGRPVEAVGPLVLGERLSNSRAANAYESIVYKKGAVVIDMLAGFWGEETFVEILGRLTRAAAGFVVSTEDFFALLERITEAELQTFTDRFVYGTGLPEIYYDYSFKDLGNGKHQVSLQADQEVPYRFAYEVVETPKGLDIKRTRINQIENRAVPMVVPFQVVLDKGKSRKKDAKIHTLNGRMAITERHTELTIEIEEKPKSLELDANNQVFGRFFDRHSRPKRTDFFRAIDTFATGDLERSRELFLNVLEVSTPAPADATRAEAKSLRHYDQRYDWQVYLHLARLEIAAGQLEMAAEHLAKARQVLPKGSRELLPQQKLAEAHLALLQGRNEEAYRDLKRIIRKQGRRATTETWLLWGIASWAAGRLDDAQECLEIVADTGAKVEPLRRRVEAAQAGKTG